MCDQAGRSSTTETAERMGTMRDSALEDEHAAAEDALALRAFGPDRAADRHQHQRRRAEDERAAAAGDQPVAVAERAEHCRDRQDQPEAVGDSAGDEDRTPPVSLTVRFGDLLLARNQCQDEWLRVRAGREREHDEQDNDGDRLHAAVPWQTRCQRERRLSLARSRPIEEH
jgi:hypothetical protein